MRFHNSTTTPKKILGESVNRFPFLSMLFIGVITLMMAPQAFASDKWFPASIDIWEPPFNDKRQRKNGQYTPVNKASKIWKICVSIPHLKDAYWLAVNYGIIDQAKQLGVAVQLSEAGGYDNLALQRQKVKQCMSTGANGLILSSISLDGFNDLIKKYVSEGRPVIDLINGISSDKLSARSAVTFWDNGYQVAKYLVSKHKIQQGKIRVAWFPGPVGAGWVEAGNAGFRHGAREGSIQIIATRFGDTGRESQTKLIEAVLNETTDIDYIIGTTVTAEAAVKVLRRLKLSDKIKVLPYYYGPGIHKGIKRGYFQAAPSDMQSIQARIAVDQMVRILDGKPYLKHVAPKVMVIDRANIRQFDTSTSLPPRGFRPVFSVNQWNR